MSENPDESRSATSFDQGTVDRWQVFGGVAGVLSLLGSIFAVVKDWISVPLVSGVVLTAFGVVLLYRWVRNDGKRRRPRLLWPVTTTVVGAVLVGLTAGIQVEGYLRKAEPLAVSPASEVQVFSPVAGQVVDRCTVVTGSGAAPAGHVIRVGVRTFDPDTLYVARAVQAVVGKSHEWESVPLNVGAPEDFEGRFEIAVYLIPEALANAFDTANATGSYYSFEDLVSKSVTIPRRVAVVRTSRETARNLRC
ncbi:hypothetical protein [Umezawaea sp. Da 62-37]|uniref:hypothetical protein n=1 Tax=Umezawaea sp. Da 62-37 TaxID=3075927 RepID=UPI0028F6FEA8|nr:hypothetical protein [Umezawaea sp. Da 62-37]WNV83500.1 hypothetical protein RM788_35730 [Umezawaea sp. Da 62-37]